jgi:rSAM/selenodomain-associated transferase 1
VFLLVMAKTPVAGRVKTRLCPPCTPHQAADLAMAALLDTLDAALASGADEVVLALAGEPGCWVPPGVRVVPQRGHGFDERLAHAWCDVGGPAFQIGMDTPQLDAQVLDDAMARLDDPGVEAALGPADDGGWWGIGLRRADPRVFLGVPMSHDHTCEAQFARLRRLGLETCRLGSLTDVDTIDDARRVASDHPSGRFGQLFASYEFPDP